MIIDYHTHIGGSGSSFGTVENLLQSMDEAGIDKSLVFASYIGRCSNQYLLKEIAPYKDRLYGVGTVYLKVAGCRNML